MELPSANPHSAGPPQARLDFDGASGSIARARETAAGFLTHHIPHLRGTFRDDVLLVVSELVTNAVRHAPGPITLGLGLLPDAIEITVRDTNPRHPRSRPPDRTGGLGWPIVHRLARRVHVVAHPDGKTVHAVIGW